MFTGIITHLGKITNKKDTKISIEADQSLLEKLEKGTSISVNGTCLTVLEKPKKKSFTVEIMPETQKKTTFGQLKTANLVNLELPTTPETMLSGHIVQGHIDSIGTIKHIEPKGNSYILTIEIPQNLSKYIVEKGSIALNGISLTVIEAADTHFTVGIIPFTWQNTMLHTIKEGTPVNIETDVLAKYLEKLTRQIVIPVDTGIQKI